jgi:hypothetical protein
VDDQMSGQPNLISEDIYDNLIHLEAIVRLLEAKGLLTEEEIQDEVWKIKALSTDEMMAN